MIIPLVTAALLFGPQTPEGERKTKLSAFFTPAPGSRLELDRHSFLENRKTPSLIKGTVWVKPPKGQCFFIRGDLRKKDKRVCKPTPLTWTIDDLDPLGHLNWLVLIEAEWDDGLLLKWNTDYRVGNFTAAGDKEEGLYEDIVINSCKATEIDGERSILIESFEGRRWRLTLPEFDTPVNEQLAAIPNLMVNIDSKKNPDGSAIEPQSETDKKKAEAKDGAHGDAKSKDEHGDKKDEHDGKPEDKKDAKKAESGGGSVLGRLLSGAYKEDLSHAATYNLPVRDAYQMESGRFTETGSPKGMNGECRYMFKNAPGDSKSGAIECHDTDTMDNVYVHLTCFSELKPRLKPKAPAGKEGTKK